MWIASLPSICRLTVRHVALSRTVPLPFTPLLNTWARISSLRLQFQNRNANSELNYLIIYHHGSAQSSLNARGGSRKGLKWGSQQLKEVIAKSELETLSMYPIKARISQTSSFGEQCCILLSFLFWCENDLKDAYDLDTPVHKLAHTGPEQRSN